ncbi:hypothetical protein [Fulvivirga lutea]|uniref:Uncharacterized protein n=1 Tax=Fulvivirga lutea TaxID=2810512 RepID=A0A974WE05_9BACT|nr:hypothetical protein [Fulvivirga lutea]QSE96524.1 hypothetical protein JR347_13060 [Fulvivirga lutea]
MKKLVYLIILISAVNIQLVAQKKYKYELGLENGEVIKTNALRHEDKRSYFQVKRDRYKYKDVKYFIDKDDYYLKSEPGPSMYLRRVHGEKVCAYSGRRTQNKPEGSGYEGMFGGSNAVGIGEFAYYYQKPGGEFKQMTLENLKEDLKDNEASMLVLSEIENDNNSAGNRAKMLEALDVYNKYNP